jgi:hypothetical protein
VRSDWLIRGNGAIDPRALAVQLGADIAHAERDEAVPGDARPKPPIPVCRDERSS